MHSRNDVVLYFYILCYQEEFSFENFNPFLYDSATRSV